MDRTQIRNSLQALADAYHSLKLMEAIENTPEEVEKTTKAFVMYFTTLDKLADAIVSRMEA